MFVRLTERLMNLKGTFTLVFIGLFVSPGICQFKNIMLDEQDGTGQYVCEPTIAINPRHSNNIVAGALADNVYYSKDHGATWKKGKVSLPAGEYGDPVIISDAKGNFYYFHSSARGASGASQSENAEGIVFHQSDDGGATWMAGEPIGINQPKDQKKESATTDSKGNLYLTWTQFDKYGDENPECHSRIMFAMSKNAKKWSDPVVISQLPGTCLGDDNTTHGAVPAVTTDGKVFVAWSNQGKIYLDRSFNGGSLWLNNDIQVAEQTGGWSLEIPGHDRCNGMPVLITDNSKSPYRGSLYLVWADQRKGEHDTDIWFTRSHNFGDNWSPPARINDDGEGKHQYMPSMAVDNETGYLYIVYYDRRNYDDNQTDVYLAYSTDGGVNFKNMVISEKSFTPQEDRFFGDYNNVSAHGGMVVPIWTRMDDGKTSVWTSVIRQEELLKAK
jgi:hypothetical protein